MATATTTQESTMTTTFYTEQFQYTHGTQPRGGWRWWFQNRSTKEVVQFDGKYSEAKRQCAKAHPGQSFTVMT
jgi:hypothetical protein